jgi:ribosomal protein S18 acetylase RimI-like enzyme
MWLILLILLICVAIIIKLHLKKSEIEKISGGLLEKLLYNQRWLFISMDEVQLLPKNLLEKINTLIMRMDYDPKIFWDEMPTSHVLIIMDDEKKEPIGFLKTLKTNTCEPLFERVSQKGSFVDDLRETIYISSVFIHPQYRGSGYGEKLVSLAGKIIKMHYHGASRIILEVKKINKPAYKLYEKLGYKIIGKDKEAYLMMLEF